MQTKASRLYWQAPAAVFGVCSLLCFLVLPGRKDTPLPLALAADLLVTAPLLGFLLARPGARWRVALRVFLLGISLAGLLLPTNEVPTLALLRRWVAPACEALLIGYLVGQLRRLRNSTSVLSDPLDRCRALLLGLTGNARVSALLAAEFTLPLYLFRRAPAGFSSGRQSGATLVLGCFLGLFLVETVALHFLLHLWKPLLAWLFTGAGLYSCLQLAAHIRALRVRPSTVHQGVCYLRNGILGGDADIPCALITAVHTGNRLVMPEGTERFGLIPKLEAPTVLLELSEAVAVRRALGRMRRARFIALSVDDAAGLAAALQSERVAF